MCGLVSSDASALTNGSRLPVVLAMNCLNGYFHDIFTESLAEALLKAADFLSHHRPPRIP
jgi:hypothetical protein